MELAVWGLIVLAAGIAVGAFVFGRKNSDAARDRTMLIGRTMAVVGAILLIIMMVMG